MGAMIKANETRRGTMRKVSRQSELLRSVLVHVVSALVCCYSYWFPWFYCFINHFVWIYLPTIWDVVFEPKCMFVVANVIVVVVVGEWRQTCAKSRNLQDDMYDEFVRRSRGPRRVLVYKKVERKQDATVKKNYPKAIEIKKVEITKEIVEEKKVEFADEIHEKKEDIIETNVTIPEESSEVIPDEKQEADAETNKSVEDTGKSHEQHDTASQYIKNVIESKSATERQSGYSKKSGETRSTDDDLNSRVEAFIARVNKRRWAEDEANNWLICST